ncbi:MAG: DNA-3-methyladenine glycosylase [Candidatus Omnitrophota bacterium]|nr:MAG: DNA-3-methyladenine glycosylase [Candidatus Omnitrophota bacterium]
MAFKLTGLRKRAKKFFLRNAKSVARDILGDYLVLKNKNHTLVGKIVETEAYLGKDDDASHSFRGKVTPRNKILYSEGAKIYTYLIYGKFYCFNIVVSKKDDPQAVFIRALEPLEGIELMQRRRKMSALHKLTNGPCRWTQSFGINKSFLGKSIVSKDIFIAAKSVKNSKITAAKRVGVDYATQSKNLPLRFYIKDNSFVSRR